MLIRRFSIPHFLKGVKEVHIVFHRPACNRRDAEHIVSSDHEHFVFNDVVQVPQRLRKLLN